MSLSPGARLGSYEVTARIGAGGMGEVYRARDTKLDRDVALKVLPDAFTSDPDRLARFEREAKVLASLNHPNIGHIYGLEEAEGTKALVLGFIVTASILVLTYAGSAHAQQVEAPPNVTGYWGDGSWGGARVWETVGWGARRRSTRTSDASSWRC